MLFFVAHIFSLFGVSFPINNFVFYCMTKPDTVIFLFTKCMCVCMFVCLYVCMQFDFWGMRVATSSASDCRLIFYCFSLITMFFSTFPFQLVIFVFHCVTKSIQSFFLESVCFGDFAWLRQCYARTVAKFISPFVQMKNVLVYIDINQKTADSFFLFAKCMFWFECVAA